VRRSLENLIRSVGLRAETFASAQEFLRSKRPDVPGCLVLDVRLPGVSGFAVEDREAVHPHCTIRDMLGHRRLLRLSERVAGQNEHADQTKPSGPWGEHVIYASGKFLVADWIRASLPR